MVELKGVAYPGDAATRGCRCGKLMVARVSPHSLSPGIPVFSWNWHCFECNHDVEGGTFYFCSLIDTDQERWTRANRDRP